MIACHKLDWDLLESRYEDAGLILFEKRIDRLRNPRNDKIFERLVLESADWADLNVQTRAWCRQVANAKLKRIPGMSPQAAYATEKAHLLALPA